MNNETVSEFDRLVGALEGLPDVTKTKPTTIRAMLPLVGIARSYIVQTYRQRDKGDTIFLETLGNEKPVRIPIPPEVANAIARQRDALSSKVRSKIAKQTMADRMAAGFVPNFAAKKPTEMKPRKPRKLKLGPIEAQG
jgi:hypothetical protein